MQRSTIIETVQLNVENSAPGKDKSHIEKYRGICDKGATEKEYCK